MPPETPERKSDDLVLDPKQLALRTEVFDERRRRLDRDQFSSFNEPRKDGERRAFQGGYLADG